MVSAKEAAISAVQIEIAVVQQQSQQPVTEFQCVPIKHFLTNPKNFIKPARVGKPVAITGASGRLAAVICNGEDLVETPISPEEILREAGSAMDQQTD